jgi:hypothetical protein
MDRKWKKKFDEAEATPNPRVWDKIAADLDASSPKAGASFTRYWAWAAAVAAFAMSGALVWYVGNQNTQNEIAQTIPQIIETTPATPLTSNSIISTNDQGVSVTDDIPDDHSSQKLKKSSVMSSALVEKRAFSAPTNKSAETPVLTDDSEGNKTSDQLIVENETLASTDLGEDMQQMTEEQSLEEKPAEVEKFEYPEAEDFLIEKKKSKSNKNRMWVGVAQGVGGYSSQMSSGNVAPAGDFAPFSLERAMEELQTDERGISEQIALTTGVFVGVPVADKVSIVTGLTYNKSNFSSAAVNINGELLHFTADVVQLKEGVNTASYDKVDIQGSYEMAVMPVLADFTLLSGNFDWSMQAGPEVGLLMRQQISSDDTGMSRTTRPGDVYRPIHLRVALGSTLSYAISDNFQVSFQPIVEQAVTSITSSSASFKSYPMNYSALFGVRYTFN